jgi:uridine nucleosidase
MRSSRSRCSLPACITITMLWVVYKLVMKVWLDCDPGHDDMLAIVMAALSPPLTLIGVSTSAGNSTVDNTTRNALDILHEIGRDDV